MIRESGGVQHTNGVFSARIASQRQRQTEDLVVKTQSIRRSGFTLTEMIVAVGIIGVVLGAGMPSLMAIISKSDAGSPPNVIALIHQRNVEMSKQFAAAGTVYGFTITYVYVSGTPTAAGAITTGSYRASTITPWYSWTTGGTSPTYTFSEYAKPEVEFPATLPVLGSDYDLEGKMRAATNTTPTPARGISFFIGNGNESRQTYSGATTFLHVACEPGTGMTHAAVTTTATPDTIDTPSELFALTPRRVDIFFRYVANGVYSNKLVLYQNGTTAVLAP